MARQVLASKPWSLGRARLRGLTTSSGLGWLWVGFGWGLVGIWMECGWLRVGWNWLWVGLGGSWVGFGPASRSASALCITWNTGLPILSGWPTSHLPQVQAQDWITALECVNCMHPVLGSTAALSYISLWSLRSALSLSRSASTYTRTLHVMKPGASHRPATLL